MNREPHEEIMKRFRKRHNLKSAKISEGLADMICSACAPYLLMIESLDQIDLANPTSGLLLRLVDRTYNTVAGALSLIAIGHLREAELLARSAYEGAATTAYIASDNPSLRMVQFFRAYTSQEREQNRRWLHDTANLPAEAQSEHRRRIEQKTEALTVYDEFIAGYSRIADVDHSNVPSWPNLIDRLNALGEKISYRTVYAAMCSQSHHDAEDILNDFIVKCHTGEEADALADRIEREADCFSLFMVLFSLKFFNGAVLCVCRELNFSTAVEEAKKSSKTIENELHIVAENLEAGLFPKRWLVG